MNNSIQIDNIGCLYTANEKGVQVFAHRIRWGVGSDDEGKAWWDGEIPVAMEEE